jgi:hypothetical protein
MSPGGLLETYRLRGELASEAPMQLTLYRRSYAVAGAPVALSFLPDPSSQHHTFTANGQVYEARRREVLITVPDDAKVDALKNVLCWRCNTGLIRSTAQEVFALATTGDGGFQVSEKRRSHG